jgi:signal transduction histidine kinase/ligand-binding sensor domain-containing protein
VLTLLGSLWSIDAKAIDPERAMSQYIHDRWESDKGFPGGPVYAITQTADGYLWIAAEKGLVRFDGLSFRLFQPPELAAGSDSAVLGVAPGADGSLWARLRRASVVRYHDGTFNDPLMNPDRPRTLVTAMAPGNGGDVLVADRRRGVIVGQAGRFEAIVETSAMPTSFVISLAQMPGGDVWLGTRDSGLLKVKDGRVTVITRGLPDQKINCLLPDGQQLWIGTDRGVVRWNGTEVTRSGLPDVLAGVQALTIGRDRDANVWIGTASGGLLRVNARGVASLDAHTQSRETVTTVFEDRDGNLWVGTARGVERWRDGVFTIYATVPGMTSGSAGPIFVDSAGRTWFAPSSGGLYWLRDGQIGREPGMSDEVIYSMTGAPDELWIGRQRGGLTRVRGQGDSIARDTFTQADGLAQNNVSVVHRARDGAIWAGTLSGGVSRFRNGVFTTYTTADGLASNTVAAILEAADGTMWFATPNGLSAQSNREWHRYSTNDGLPSNDVNTLFEDSGRQLWIGTAAGLALFQGGRLQPPLKLPPLVGTSVLGFAEDRAGYLWISAADRVLRVNRERLARGSIADADVREYGPVDGLPGVEGIKRHRSLVVDSRGRIWLSTSRGLSMADPARVESGAAPVLVHVEALSADGAPFDRPGAIDLPPRRQRITLAYNGLSLSVPERIMFRYRLDGFDREWSVPSRLREAVYTNLGPGGYRFRVMASNSDGVWSGQEAVIQFRIRPAFWQTVWFRIAAMLCVAAAAWAAHRVRMMQVAHQLSVRFEARVTERTRIARELHDTLLQGFHGLLLRFQGATNALPEGPAKTRFESAIDLAAQAIAEARDAVQGLRSSAIETNDLAAAITSLGQALAADDTTANSAVLHVAVEGTPRNLHPILRDELYRIAGEALRNAFRHAQARQIEVEIRYDEHQLRLRVRDDGKGMAPQVPVEQGTSGHFGLPGMHERATLVGGRLDIWSDINSGTEVELRVPGVVAYATPSAPRRFWLSRDDC